MRNARVAVITSRKKAINAKKSETIAAINSTVINLDKLMGKKVPRKSVAIVTQVSRAQIVPKVMEKFTRRARVDRRMSSSHARGFFASSRISSWASSTLARSMIRPRRFARTLSNVDTPEMRNTGAIACWMTCAMAGPPLPPNRARDSARNARPSHPRGCGRRHFSRPRAPARPGGRSRQPGWMGEFGHANPFSLPKRRIRLLIDLLASCTHASAGRLSKGRSTQTCESSSTPDSPCEKAHGTLGSFSRFRSSNWPCRGRRISHCQGEFENRSVVALN
jgi:hypothetical protein